MRKNSRFVSVVIPVHNGAVFLEEAVESILQQNHPSLEIIIIDDGSTDRTAAVVKSLGGKIRYRFQPQSGPAVARNHGIGQARGEVIGFLDADDLWTKDKLSIQLTCLEQNPQVDVVVGCTQRAREIKIVNGQLQFQPIHPIWMAFSLGSALFRRTVFDPVGHFDETQFFGEDVDWFLRAREIGLTMFVLKRVTQVYRIHQNNMTKDVSTGNRYFLQALKKSLDRRKQRNGAVYDLPLPPELSQFQNN